VVAFDQAQPIPILHHPNVNLDNRQDAEITKFAKDRTWNARMNLAVIE
jgi:hypothetical protein